MFEIIKLQATVWEKIFAKPIANKELESRQFFKSLTLILKSKTQ